MSILTLIASFIASPVAGGLASILQTGFHSFSEYKNNKIKYTHELEMAKIEAERDLKMVEVNKEIAAINYEQQKEIHKYEQRMQEVESNTEIIKKTMELHKVGIQSQISFLEKAAAWVSTLSATVRPMLTYLIFFDVMAIAIVEIYFVGSGNETAAASLHDMPAVKAIILLFEFIMGYWFMNRRAMELRGIK